MYSKYEGITSVERTSAEQAVIEETRTRVEALANGLVNKIEVQMGPPLSFVLDALDEFGFSPDDVPQTNGWQGDFWQDFEKNSSLYKLSACQFYGSYKIEKQA